MSVAVDDLVPGRILRGSGLPAATDSAGDGVRDDWFDGIDLGAVSAAGLSAAAGEGCQHADVRITNTRTAYETARDDELSGAHATVDRGLAVRVLHQGRWGFAAVAGVDRDAAELAARRAVAMARLSAPLGSRPVALAPEPAHRGWWASAALQDPFDVPAADRADLLVARSAELLRDRRVSHAEAECWTVRERVHYADLAGSFTQQQRIRVAAEWTAIQVGAEGFESMRTLAPPAARGWEYLVGPVAPGGGAPGWDFDAEIAAMPELLAEKAAAPSVVPGRYTLLLDPTHLWLTIHESVGHATELDRALGYEANYAGTTFARPEDRGSLSYGSTLMHVTGDRTAPHGLATAAFDDEGVAAQSWDIIAEGTLVDFQLDRSMAAEFGRARSNGCAYADSYAHVPIQRMPNVSLQPAPAGPDLRTLVADVDDGLLLLGDNSWSIDMQRYNFQFSPQRALRIRDGQIEGQVKDAAYQSTTPDFWHALAALGGPQTYMLGGALNCGKGQPGQVAPVSHGCPPARFEDIAVLNSSSEGGP